MHKHYTHFKIGKLFEVLLELVFQNNVFFYSYIFNYFLKYISFKFFLKYYKNVLYITS